MMCSYVDKLQRALDEEILRRNRVAQANALLQGKIERMESFMESIGACTECCHDPCRCEKHVVIPD